MRSQVMKLTDRTTLEMALIGYGAERQKIEAAMAAIRKQVNGHTATPAVDGDHRPKRVMSAAAKRRIAAAQRKRWSAFHAEQKGGTTKTGPKRKLSAPARAKLAANLAKARTARAAKTKRVAKAA
jgi:hypothetical protein